MLATPQPGARSGVCDRSHVALATRYDKGTSTMTLTFGTTGMDQATEAAIHAAFNEANAACGNRWVLTGDDNAEYIVVDMDSLYGPMSWLKLHGLGRKVIGLTKAQRSKTPYRLPKPITASDLAVLLSEIAGEETHESSLVSAEAKHSEPPQTRQEATPAPVATLESKAAAVDAAPEPQPEAAAASAPGQNAADDAPEIQPVAASGSETSQSPRTLRGWLGARGARRVRVTAKDGTVVLLDTQAGVWHGPKELKACTPCFSAEPGNVESEILDDAAWAAAAAKLGASQPIVRLQWLGGLLSGNPAHGAFRLRKWPQIEREYPRHFRIATIMMKSAADIGEIAQAAGVPENEVRDFINASLATGYATNAKAEAEAPTPAAPPAAPASSRSGVGGLFGRRKK